MILGIKARTLRFRNVSIAVRFRNRLQRAEGYRSTRPVWWEEFVFSNSEDPSPCVPLPARSSRGEGMFFGVVYPGLRTSERRSKRGDVLTWATVRSLLTEFSVWLAARAIGLTPGLRQAGPNAIENNRGGFSASADATG